MSILIGNSNKFTSIFLLTMCKYENVFYKILVFVKNKLNCINNIKGYKNSSILNGIFFLYFLYLL